MADSDADEWGPTKYHSNQGWIECGSKNVAITVSGYGEFYQVSYTDPFLVARTRTSVDAGAKAWRSWTYYTGNGKVKVARGRVGFDNITIPDDPITSGVTAFCY